EDLPDPAEFKITKRELDIAKQLVGSLAGDFEPDKYRDSYRQDVLALIERKAQGEEIALQPPAEEVSVPAPDLMSALKASLDAGRAKAGEAAGEGAPKRRKAAAKKTAGEKPAGGKAPGSKAARKKPGASRTT